jgi:hypothetical protein
VGLFSWLFGKGAGLSPQPVRSAGKIPLSTFDGYAKQIRSEMLEQRSRDFLSLAFPGFLKELGEVNPTILTPTQEFSGVRLRRYAGGTQLPPGQYFTVARGPAGDDGGTLVAELLSYWNEEARLAAWITDPAVPGQGDESVREHVRAQFGDKPCLCISIAEVLGVQDGIMQLATEFALVVPVLVTPVHATHVVDLRLPQVQDWFCGTFGTLEKEAIRRRFGGFALLKPADFRELIPTLVHPAAGGIAFHHAVGAWLSSHGVSALIYPSARRDARAAAEGQNVVSHDGWNLVAFGGLQGELPRQMDFDQFGYLGKWLSPEDSLIEVDWQQTPQGRAWAVRGAEGREAQRRRSLLMEVLEKEQGKPGWLRERLESIGFSYQGREAGPSRSISVKAMFNE